MLLRDGRGRVSPEKWQAKRNRKRLKSDSETLLTRRKRTYPHIRAGPEEQQRPAKFALVENPFNLSLKKALACRRSSAAISSWGLYFFNSIPRLFYLLWDHYFD